jgi:hypothetical protein
MHSRRLACLLLGLWLGGGLLMQWVTRESLLGVDRVLAQPDPAATLRIKVLGRDQVRLLLRYEVSEQNRYNLELWEIVQVVLAAIFFFFLLFGTSEGKFSLTLALLLLVLVVAQRFVLTPEMKAMGRMLDFGSPSAVVGERAKYGVMHYAYLVVEASKWTLQAVLGFILITRGRLRSSDSRQKLDPNARGLPRYDR